MEIKDIDKVSYKQNLNRLQGGVVVGLFVLAIPLSELFTSLWGNPEGGNTLLNLLAVATAVAIVALVFNLIKHQSWLADVRYTWKLKQELNRIYRSSKLMETALAANDRDAYVVQWFNLNASRHLYRIEDNTLTVPELSAQIRDLEAELEGKGWQISEREYSPELLDILKKRYK